MLNIKEIQTADGTKFEVNHEGETKRFDTKEEARRELVAGMQKDASATQTAGKVRSLFARAGEPATAGVIFSKEALRGMAQGDPSQCEYIEETGELFLLADPHQSET